MLGRVDPQGSLLETRFVRRRLATKGSFYERLPDHHEIISDDTSPSVLGGSGAAVDTVVGDDPGVAVPHP
jgi:hypothetical protein